MSAIPTSWIEVRFGDLNCFSSRALDPRKTPDERFELYSVPSFPSGQPELVLGSAIGSTKQLVEPDDVLVCKINPRINRVWQVLREQGLRQIASSEWIVMRAPEVEPRFLRHFFSCPEFRELICEGVTGVGGSLTRAQPKRVATFAIPLAPRNEQKRIADKLDAVLERVDASRERLDRVRNILKRFRQSVLAAAVTGKLTEEWRSSRSDVVDSRSISFEDDSIPVPSHWADSALTDLIDPARPLCYGVVQPGTENRGGVPLIRVQDMDRGTILIDKLRTVSAAIDKEYRRSRVKEGDLLVSVVGTIGRTALVPANLEANIARAIARIACKAGINSRWVNIWLSCDVLQWWLMRSAREVARKTLNLSDLGAARIAVPPHEEQNEIVHRVEALFAYADRLEASHNMASAQVERLTPALLSKAFSGDVVPQDPNDEPASVLLERIRAARSSEPANRKSVKGKSRSKELPKVEVHTLDRKEIQDMHLTKILKEHGPLTAEALWSASQLGIDDFYDRLNDEETRGLLKEKRGKLPTLPRLLEATE